MNNDSPRTLTSLDLIELLSTAAGPPETSDAEFLDTDLESLGYDSLARLETGALIQAHYGVRLPDDTIVAAQTPRELLTLVNDTLTEQKA